MGIVEKRIKRRKRKTRKRKNRKQLYIFQFVSNNMKKILTFCLILIGYLGYSQTKSTLFIGNSYTGVNNLPQLTSQLATSAGFTLNYSAQTPGGAQLIQHISNASVTGAIYSQNWDFVVLQEQSQKPSFGPASVAANVYPYAKRLCDTIRQKDSCTQPIFYMTWGRKFGDAGNCPVAPWLCTYAGMDSALAVSYNTMGQQNDAFVSPVGAVWNYIIKNHSSINLYSSDNSHPSTYGTYAAACTFFSVIFREDPTLITNNYTINASDAAIIRNAVKVVCYDSLSKWNVGKFDPVASFSSNTIGTSIQFTNSSIKSATYLWKFGDGNTSTLPNPTHTYSTGGTYTVTLIATKCGLSDTVVKSLTTATTGIQEQIRDEFFIYPNPSNTGLFFIETKNEVNQVLVYSVQGKLVESVSLSSTNIPLDLSHLTKGIYLLKIEGRGVKKVVIE